MARVPGGEISLDGLDAIERGVYRAHRWWTVAELDATTEKVYPPQLPDVLRKLAPRSCG